MNNYQYDTSLIDEDFENAKEIRPVFLSLTLIKFIEILFFVLAITSLLFFAASLLTGNIDWLYNQTADESVTQQPKESSFIPMFQIFSFSTFILSVLLKMVLSSVVKRNKYIYRLETIISGYQSLKST